MAGNLKKQQVGYRQFVELDLSSPDEEFIKALHESPLCIGEEGFRAWVEDSYKKLEETQEDVEHAGFRRIGVNISLDDIVSSIQKVFQVDYEHLRLHRSATPFRGIAAMLLCKYGGMSLQEVADWLGLRSGSTVSYQIKRAQEHISKNKKLEKKVNELVDSLNM